MPDMWTSVQGDMVQDKAHYSTAMQAYCTIVTFDFKKLLDTVKEEQGRCICYRGDTVIINLPYHPRSARAVDFSAHDARLLNVMAEVEVL